MIYYLLQDLWGNYKNENVDFVVGRIQEEAVEKIEVKDEGYNCSYYGGPYPNDFYHKKFVNN